MNADLLHAFNRLGYGPSPVDASRFAHLSPEQFVETQLSPASIPLPPTLERQLKSFKTLNQTPQALFDEYGPPRRMGKQKRDAAAIKAARKRSRIIRQEGIQARLLRAVYSPRQLEESLVDFWYNHFNVFAGKGLDHLWYISYEQEAIRPHVLGRFEDLLTATALHPAMLFYLDNWLDTDPDSPGARGRFKGINENYAREVMELHTLGINGGYTQADVITLAHILTGWSLRPGIGATFFPHRHDFSDKTFLGQHIRGSGKDEARQALQRLARHPSTAHHISYQLTQYFLADTPPADLVQTLSRRYQDSDGHIAEVLRTLFSDQRFWQAHYRGNKFKTPYRYAISTLRACGLDIHNTRPIAGMLALQGMPLYGCLTPDGYKNTQDAWLNPNALMLRLNFATAIGAGYLRLGPPNDPRIKPDPATLVALLTSTLSPGTRTAVRGAPKPLQAAALLGSPEFMYC